jgi:hypothetical protein
MKIVLMLLLFFAFDVSAQVIRPTSFDGRAVCEKSKGVWRQFGNGCADSCDAKFDEFAVCTDAIISSCDCGKGRCWNGSDDNLLGACVSLSEFQRIFDQQQAEENKQLEKASKERLARYKKQRRKMMEQFVQQSSGETGQAATNSDGSPAPASNNLSSFYNKAKKKNEVVDVVPTEQISTPQAILQPVPPLDSEQKKNGGFLSMFVGDGVTAIEPTVPPTFLEQEKTKQAATNSSQQDVVAGGPSSATATTTPAPNQTTSTATTQPTIGVTPDARNPHQQLLQSKSLVGNGANTNTNTSPQLPQLPMPQ